MNFEGGHFALTSDASIATSASDVSAASMHELGISCPPAEGAHFQRALASNLLSSEGPDATAAGGASGMGGDGDAPHRVLAFKTKAPAPSDGHVSNLRVLYTQNTGGAGQRVARSVRHVPSAPERILDAPNLVDDYYLNLMDWSVADVLAIALGTSVYLWEGSTGAITELMHTTAPDDFVTSVSWIRDGGGSHLAIGTAGAEVLIYDAERKKQLRCLRGHTARVGALDWNAHVLSSGSRDATILHHDVRVREARIARLTGHTQEICGLRWSPDGASLATGGNDNTLCIWGGAADGATQAPRFTLTDHQAAVKAVAWCPWQRGLLATGGGTADRCIKTWNGTTGALLQSVDTGSQVCALAWSPHERELLSAHGFSQNQLTLWKYPSLVRVKELTGHTARVLHLATGPDGCTVASAGADEAIRFWRVFGEAPGAAPRAASSKADSAAVAAAARDGVGASPSIIRGLAIR